MHGMRLRDSKEVFKETIGIKSTTSYQVMLLETSVLPIEMVALQSVYRYITKVKYIPDHRLPHLAHKNKSLIQLGSWRQKMVKKMGCGWSPKAFKWSYEYVVIEERLMDPLRNKWKDAKRTKFRILHCKHKSWM